ncbi:FIST signal transduction protein [Colwellia psychrerythraea]|uniref:FIST domain-containing protein n=1 Tax=Colwellia psychrerythraea TaxID=28229 RepID=A0A099L442_COLPS|nr:FIST C-terminal domain-containing protein [Colwellia psychrerythraea]KGJ97601.1 protein of unknown function DUF1745 [Colwellia psychrerythraea]
MNTGLFTWHTHSNALSDFKYGLSLAKSSGAKSLLVLTCSQNHYPEDQLSALLSTCSLTVFGGIYPMLTLQNTLLEQGALIIGFHESFDVTLFSQLHQVTDEESLEALITSTLEAKDNYCGRNDFLMFYDSLINNIEDFIDCMFECLDHGINIAGGGAGNLDFIQNPCIFTNQGLHKNAVLLVTIPNKVSVGVAHGWKIFKGPFLVSNAHENTVYSLNYQSAFEVYCQAIESASDYKFNNSNFFDIAKNFPLGIEDINHNLIVRDPIYAHKSDLKCAGSIPINSMVYLLKSDTDTLIASAEQAAITAFSTPTEITSTTMIFDCISRVLYMEDKFEQELDVIAKHCTTPILFGVLSLGEIANSPSGAIRLLNKSTVISSW